MFGACSLVGSCFVLLVLPTHAVHFLRPRIRRVSSFSLDSSTKLRQIIGTWFNTDQGQLVLTPLPGWALRGGLKEWEQIPFVRIFFVDMFETCLK